MSQKPLKIFICAGEPSGDLHGAALMQSLRRKINRPIAFRGFGGDQMRAAGADLLYHTDQTALIGITPVLTHLPFLLGMIKNLKRVMLSWKPDLVITVDYPEMNLMLAKFAHRNHIPNLHYICPQVWAWRRGRIPKIAKILDMMLCILPFEPECFSGTALDIRYTGHPLVDRAAETRAEPPLTLPWHGKTKKIALLPGSRVSEVTRILPRMLDAAALTEEKLNGDCAFVIPAASAKMRKIAQEIIDRQPRKPKVLEMVDGNARQVLLQADAAAVASGTATLEACLMRCPTVLVYAASWLTYQIGKNIIKGVKFLGLANIIADREIMPELIQDAYTAEALADRLTAFSGDPETRAATLAGLDIAIAKLGNGGASDNAAEAIVEKFFPADVTP